MFISRYAAVNPPVLLLNGSIVLTNDADDPAQFIKSSYRALKISYPKFYKMDNLSKLAFISTEILLNDTEITSIYPAEKIGMILLNSSSSLETDEKHQESISDRENYFPSPSVFVYTLANIMVGEISIRHKIKGENGVIITDRPDANLIFTIVNELFTQKRVTCCIAGWVEAYHDRLTSCLMLVENEEIANSYSEQQEMFIFDPSNIERIFKEVLKDGTNGKA